MIRAGGERLNDYGEKTRQRLKIALEELIEYGGERNPTVSALLKQAHVARSTFYVYYENFDDLLEELATDYAAQVKDLIEKNRGSGTGVESYRDAYQVFIRFIASHKNIYAMLLKRPKLERLFVTGICEYLFEQYRADFPAEDPELLHYSAYACTNFVYSIIRQWAENGFDKSSEEVSDLLTDSIRISTDLFL